MPIKAFSFENNTIEPSRYHIRYSDKSITVASSDDKKLKQKMKNAVDTELCTKERCILCHSYNMALMPTIQPGQILLFTSGDFDCYSIQDVLVITKAFNPYSDEFNGPEDILKLGYGERVQFLELWSSKSW